jgi:hypothetical protein
MNKETAQKKNGQSARALAEAAQRAAVAEAEAIQAACWKEVEPILKKFDCVLVGEPKLTQIPGTMAAAIGAVVNVRYVPPQEE